MKKCLFSSKVLYNGSVIAGGILINNDIIEQIIPANNIEELKDKIGNDRLAEVIDVKDKYLLPGLIDIHTHGGYGHDIMEGTNEAFNVVSKYVARNGVTSFVPSTVTAPLDQTKKVLKCGAQCMEKGTDGAKILGFFLEGPYISREKKGAHPEQFIRSINLDEIKELIAASKNNVLRIAIAPELENAFEAIEYLNKININASIGHSNASYEVTMKAIEKGASIGIHTYNAMSGLQHREPGMVGAIFSSDAIYGEIISDNIHIHDESINILYRLKGNDKVIAITDCMAGGGLDDGLYQLGEFTVQVKDGACTLEDGTIAGSTLKLNEGLYNLMRITGEPLIKIINLATKNAAKALNLSQIGEIKEHYKADIIAADNDMKVYMTMVDGRIVFQE